MILFLPSYRALSRKYLANVSEVLDGVQKMEESLRRLKRGRDKQNANVAAAAGQEKSGEKLEKGVVSDDDKIRLQLFVDVKHYIQTVKSLGVDVDSITDDDDDDKDDVLIIEQLDQLVIEATKTCYDDYLDHVQVK